MMLRLALNGVFRTIQGEGAMLGLPMVFVRLSGCSVGCAECDTDYRFHERVSVDALVSRCDSMLGASKWVWITGGEPLDQDISELVDKLNNRGSVAVATSGRKRAVGINARFLSVSPHGSPADLMQWHGSQVNLVPGLGGTRLSDWVGSDFSGFEHRYVTPLCGSSESLRDCLDFIEQSDLEWRLGVQAHKSWEVP